MDSDVHVFDRLCSYYNIFSFLCKCFHSWGHLGSHSPLKELTHEVNDETNNVLSLVKMAEGLLKPSK